MKKCPNCGAAMPEETKFCTSCGNTMENAETIAEQVEETAQTEGESFKEAAAAEPEKKKKFPILAVVIPVAILAIVGIVAAAATALVGGRDKKFVTYQAKMIADRFGADALQKAAEQSNEIDTDLTISMTTDADTVNEILDELEIVLKLKGNDENLIMGIDAGLMGSTIVSGTITGDFTDGKGVLGAYFPEITDGYYIADVYQVAETVSDGEMVLNPGQQDYKNEDYIKSMADIAKIVWEVPNKENVTEEKVDSYRLQMLGSIDKATVYTFRPTQDDMEAFAEKLIAKYDEDAALQEYVRNFVRSRLVSDAVENGAAYLMDEMDTLEDDVDDEIDEFKDNLTDNLIDLGDNLEWKVVVENKTARQVHIYFEGNDGYEYEIFYETNGSQTDCEEAIILIEDGDEVMTLENAYTKDGEQVDGEMLINVAYSDEIEVIYAYDGATRSQLHIPYGSYSLSTDYYSYDMEVAEGKKGSTDHIITMTGDSYSYYDFSEVTVTINSSEGSTAEMPDEDPIDISDYDKEELEALYDEISRDVSDYATDLVYEIMGSSRGLDGLF
ncbi:MAG: hypothetical protein IJR58_07845 [Lachnospiraceae bacterium]|nr:hypothetical protein [Lachnospiraceae bacterium]